MNKRDILINKLNNHFNAHDEFMEISQISDSDIDKIIELYEQEASKDGKEPWNYLYFDDLIIMQKCVYDVIKDNPQYDTITSKLETLYDKELTRRLTKPVYEYGEPTGKTIRAPYTNMEEYSLTLAEMCARNMNYGGKSNEERTKAIETYSQIKNDFNKAGKEMPTNYEMQFEFAKGQIARSYVGGTPREPAIGEVYGAQDNSAWNMQQLREMQEQKVEYPDYTEEEKEEIRNQLAQAKEELRQKMNWAEQQPNEPQITSLKSDNATIDYPDDLYIQNPELVDYIHSNFSNLGKVDRILSVSGYPDPQYEVRFENGEVHTFMQPKKTNNPTPNQPNNSSLTVEQMATKMVEDMARNKIDVNGEPIVQSMENQKVLTKNMENGFAKVWILGILATLVSLGIIVLGILLNV